ncbi:hypothetical protein C6P46_005207 [Rhodotorula mucilaginosa]|uniref:Guanine nucleotide-binding protein alpha-2 subunit n=1 Tax=Rhodotorula mucilaginosa TaxID=5537 RepID=A0A9P6VYF8_RHOMI|nr:hypothetical protein C6P46_005207 [Rhodotorula mucilaginosa]
MGACNSTEGGRRPEWEPTSQDLAQSKAIDRLLRDDEDKLASEVKMLLLGPGSSGKSTILKQMKLIHLSGFTDAEVEMYRQQIFQNLRDGMKACLALMEQEGMELTNPDLLELWELGEQYSEVKVGEPFPSPLKSWLRSLWNDRGMKVVVAGGEEATIPESLPYFFEHLDRLFKPTYRPTDQDILRCRQKTTGISETAFHHRGMHYRIFDVGGQRSERRKWVHCFENVTALVFLASLSGYDQNLHEDRNSNQMQEALMLFDSICNSRWFAQTAMILFLNKQDVFTARVPVSSITSHFPDYEGDPHDPIAGQEYFRARFLRLNRSTSKEIYTHYTTAVDTKLVKVVFASVSDVILSRNLNALML